MSHRPASIVFISILALAACSGDEKTAQTDRANPVKAGVHDGKGGLAEHGQATAAAGDPGALGEQSNINQHARGHDSSGPDARPNAVAGGNAVHAGDVPTPDARAVSPSGTLPGAGGGTLPAGAGSSSNPPGAAIGGGAHGGAGPGSKVSEPTKTETRK